MTPTMIFAIGVVTVVLLVIFTYETIHQLLEAGAAAEPGPRPGAPPSPAAARGGPVEGRPMRVIVATDGSPCSDVALRSVAARSWPPGTEIEILAVVHTNVPYIPEPTLVGASFYAETLETERHKAPERAQAAERLLGGKQDLRVSSRVVEDDPKKAIVGEAERWQADLVVVGSHGYGPIKRHVLGSVSEAVAVHAPCSVEIVRCPHADAGTGRA